MHRCLVKTEELLAAALTLGRDEARHLQTVLRVKPGDRVTLFDGHGRTRTAVITAADKRGLSLASDSEVKEHAPPPLPAHPLRLCQQGQPHGLDRREGGRTRRRGRRSGYL